MLGYICKYAPIEMLESMGVKMQRIEPDASHFTQADMRMHPNICSFAKGVLEVLLRDEYEGIILTTCCDSIRRLYDVLKEAMPDKFIYMLDIPRITKDAGISLYRERIQTMISAYEEWSKKKFFIEKLKEFLKELLRQQLSSMQIHLEKDKLNIGIIGARVNDNIRQIVKEKGMNLAFDFTCTGLQRKFLVEEDDILTGYVRGLLGQFPCMRMEEAAGRDQLIRQYVGSVDGIIYHTIQFCDNYAYDYAWIKHWMDKPMLLLETDYTKQSYGQVLTRVEAFAESIEKKKPYQKKEARDLAYVMGIDSGSTSTNAVIMDQNRRMIAFSVVRTGAKSGESAERIFKEILDKADLKREDLSYIVSTGYGRVSIEFADENVTEISCHGKGVHYFNPKIRTILDIGGQDSKAIRLNERGEVCDFVMNDKCAAGTGRFLEMIAKTLEISVEELGTIALQSTENIEITSMCSVFAESEVISLIANNKEQCDIAHGICGAIANKSFSLLKRVGLEPDFMMTGGVAKNQGVVKAVEERLGAKLYICEEPEIVGAVGAALYAIDKL